MKIESRIKRAKKLSVWKKKKKKSSSYDLCFEKARILACLDLLECKYWEAWEKSKEDFKAEIVKVKKRKGKSDLIEKKIVTHNRCGDPRYLHGVLKCIDQRCKILGLYASARGEITGNVVVLSAK